MYRIAIGDDDLQFLKDFKAIVSRCMEAEHLRLGEDYAIDCYPSAPPLMSALKARKDRYQLILLDVRFGPDNGLTMAATLRESGAAFSLIYVTNHRDYVFNSFDTRPLHYLLKQVNEEKLSELVREDYRRRYQDVRLYLKSGARHTSLAFQNIVAVEAALHRVFLHLRDGTSAEWNGTLKELAPQLPGWCFCRCHNSYFVNLAHVTEMVRYEARLDNGKNIPISKRYYKPAIEHYIAFLKI